MPNDGFLPTVHDLRLQANALNLIDTRSKIAWVEDGDSEFDIVREGTIRGFWPDPKNNISETPFVDLTIRITSTTGFEIEMAVLDMIELLDRNQMFARD